MLPYPQSVAKTGSALPALQRERERQLRSSAFPNQTDISKLEMFQQEVQELFFLQTGAFIVPERRVEGRFL